MLERARRKDVDGSSGFEGDMLALPFAAATRSTLRRSGFGVRNVADLRGSAWTELRRVLRPGGRVGDPRDHAAARRAAAVLLALVRSRGAAARQGSSGGSAYTYLPASVKRFPSAEGLAALLRESGFGDVTFTLMAETIVAIHTGTAE